MGGPIANDPSLYSLGTALNEVSEILITVGNIMTLRIILAASKLFPAPPNLSDSIGTIMIRPKNPYITDGIPASNSTAGRTIRCNHTGAISAKNTAPSIPIGTPNAIAKAVAYKDPKIMGKIPNISAKGSHSVPKIKFERPISNMAGPPSQKINIVMVATHITAVNAQSINMASMIFSVISLLLFGLSNFAIFYNRIFAFH